MSGAVAYDMFDEDQYTDAHVLPLEGSKPQPAFEEDKDFSAGEDIENDESNEGQALVLPVKEITGKHYKITLRKPIAIHLEGENRQYIAMYEEARICGQGRDPEAAIRDFQAAFVSIYLCYKESEDLSPGAHQYVDFLNQLIEKIEKI